MMKHLFNGSGSIRRVMKDTIGLSCLVIFIAALVVAYDLVIQVLP